mmetsp:Transcript_25217/g.33474  ORF Transcript_25217/g.33474 Transcript_25217/m.33474 type:complete len:84 (+) Transcript_25217:561-812(+)
MLDTLSSSESLPSEENDDDKREGDRNRHDTNGGNDMAEYNGGERYADKNVLAGWKNDAVTTPTNRVFKVVTNFIVAGVCVYSF